MMIPYPGAVLVRDGAPVTVGSASRPHHQPRDFILNANINPIDNFLPF